MNLKKNYNIIVRCAEANSASREWLKYITTDTDLNISTLGSKETLRHTEHTCFRIALTSSVSVGSGVGDLRSSSSSSLTLVYWEISTLPHPVSLRSRGLNSSSAERPLLCGKVGTGLHIARNSEGGRKCPSFLINP